jgi:peroxiredoxin
MAATPSTMMPLGTIAPAFSLPDTISGNTLSLGQLRGDKATLIIVCLQPLSICAACHRRTRANCEGVSTARSGLCCNQF